MRENNINVAELQKFIDDDYFWYRGHLSVTIEYKRMTFFILNIMKEEFEAVKDVDIENRSLTINLFDRILEQYNINPREAFPVK